MNLLELKGQIDRAVAADPGFGFNPAEVHVKVQIGPPDALEVEAEDVEIVLEADDFRCVISGYDPDEKEQDVETASELKCLECGMVWKTQLCPNCKSDRSESV